MKRTLFLLLALLMITTMVACQSQPAESEKATEESSETTEVKTQPTTEPTLEPTPEVLVGDINEDGNVVYGLLAYDTDSNIFSGTAFEYAAELIGVQTESEILDIEAYYDGKATESIETLVDKGVDGICFVSLGIVELDDKIAKGCSEANVPCVIIGSDTQTRAVAKVDCDLTEAGKLLGEFIVQRYSGADVAKIISIRDMTSSQKINESFDTVLEDNGNAIIDEKEAHYDPMVAKEVLWDMIKDNGRDNVKFPVIFLRTQI